MNIKRAFISVYDKRGIEKLCNFLLDNQVEVIATPGTANYLFEKGLKVRNVRDYTGFPYVFGGRIKSIHPAIIGGIVGNPDSCEDMKELLDNNISTFDMVVVNFRPFEEVVEKTGDEYTMAHEMDIGGPTALISAVTNMRNVVAICDPEDYENVISSVEYCGDILLQKRRKYALKALYYVSGYFSSIHKSFSEIFASEKYDHFTMEYIIPVLQGDLRSQKATLLKVDTEPGLLDNVQVANPALTPTKKDIRNAYRFAELYYYLGEVSAFIINGRIVTASTMDHVDRVYSDKEAMYCSTFTIDYPVLKKLHQMGVRSFTGVFDRDALKYARENDVMLMTIPVKEEMKKSETLYSSFGDYIVREKAEEFSLPPELDSDERLALAISKVNQTLALSVVKNGRTLLLKSSLIREELKECMSSSTDFHGAVCCVDADLSNDEIDLIESRGVRRILVPGNSRKYESSLVKPLELDFYRSGN